MGTKHLLRYCETSHNSLLPADKDGWGPDCGSC